MDSSTSILEKVTKQICDYFKRLTAELAYLNLSDLAVHIPSVSEHIRNNRSKDGNISNVNICMCIRTYMHICTYQCANTDTYVRTYVHIRMYADIKIFTISFMFS